MKQQRIKRQSTTNNKQTHANKQNNAKQNDTHKNINQKVIVVLSKTRKTHQQNISQQRKNTTTTFLATTSCKRYTKKRKNQQKNNNNTLTHKSTQKQTPQNNCLVAVGFYRFALCLRVLFWLLPAAGHSSRRLFYIANQMFKSSSRSKQQKHRNNCRAMVAGFLTPPLLAASLESWPPKSSSL